MNENEVSTEAEVVETQTTENRVSLGTKIKVIAALVVVGFAGYIANWVQEPAVVSTDVFNLPKEEQPKPPVADPAPAAADQPVVAAKPAAADPAQVVPAQPVQPAPEQLVTSTPANPAPAHFAAQNVSPTLGYPAETLGEQPPLVPAMSEGKIASSGPEDFLYVGVFGLILFKNRKLLRKHKA